MDEEAISGHLSRQAADVAALMRNGCHPAKFEREVASLLAWFDLWRRAAGLPDSGMWRDGSPLDELDL